MLSADQDVPLATLRRAGAPRRVRADIYRQLRERIVSVELEPGTALSEARIAEGFGVSRTPVREAFQRLAEDGFLDVVPQVGTFVARIDLQAVRDNHFSRETLECRIVELGAARVDTAARRALRENLVEQADALDAGDAAAFFRADEALHLLLARTAGHESAWAVIHQAKSQLDRVRRLALADPGRSRRRLREHRAIVARVCAGDPAGAARAMREHLASLFEAIENIAADNVHYFV